MQLPVVRTAAEFGITDEEASLLVTGLLEWGGPAGLTTAVARAMGFDSVEDFFAQAERIKECLRGGTPMPLADRRRTLLATELVFVFDVVGSGIDWATTTGIRDADALRLLRSLQRKIVV